MDAWQAAQSWLLFSGVVGGLGVYYYYAKQDSRRPALVKRRAEDEARRRSLVHDLTAAAASKDAVKKKKAPRKQLPPKAKEDVKPRDTPAVIVQSDDVDEKEEHSARQFAEQMAKARKGANLSTIKSKDSYVKTVKQSSALNTPILSSGSSQAGADADDDLSPAASPNLNAGDVSDMLEPAAKGPSTLRLTPSAQPQKLKTNRQPKEEVLETKKQRQNRMKKEQQRLEREAEEKERKALEERQRRAAREARGEPAKNGLGVSKLPASNVWIASKQHAVATAPQVNGGANGPLLDTFDAESTASSNGGMDASTAATSTTEAESTEKDNRGHLSEEEQIAKALKESEDESGWTTVAAVPKKQKKAASNDMNGDRTPVERPASAVKPVPATAKPVEKAGKVNGFSALNVEDPAAWEA